MADIKYELGDYVITNVGPKETFSFDGQNGKVTLDKYALQFEGISDWVKINQKSGADAPTVGEVLRGHIEETDKYGLAFKKESKGGGNWGGGKGYSAGAAWANAVETSTQIVASYATLSGKKFKNIEEFLAKVKATAPLVKAMVDGLAGTTEEKKEEGNKSESESGESPAPKGNGVEIDEISEEELGTW